MFGRRSRKRSGGALPAGYFASAASAAPRARPGRPESLGDRARNWLKLSGTGALGILAAVVMDLQNRGDSSALFVVARTLVYVAALIGVTQVPLYLTILTLMGVGAAVVLYFRPHGLRPAFLTGFGSLAALMTLVPGYSGEAIGVPVQGDLPSDVELPVIERGDADRIAADARAPMRLAGFVGQEPTPEEAAKAAEPQNLDGSYEIKVRLTFSDGVPEPVSMRIQQGRLKTRLYNPATGKAYNLFLSASGPVIRDGDRLLVEAEIPSDVPQTTLLLRVEAEGYEIQVAENEVSHGENPVWDVSLTPTSEPLLIQRLKHTYAF